MKLLQCKTDGGLTMKRIVLCMVALSFALAVFQRAGAQESKTRDELKREAVAEVDKLQKLTQEMVDSIFSFAELGFQEYETSKYVTGILEKNGFKVERGVAGMPTAWVASYGSGKPVIGFITDIDCIPRASQKPGVAYHDPIIQDAPGHGEGHNSGQAVNVAAAIVLKQMMERYKLPGTLKLYPGVAEELVATKAFFVRAGLFKDVDVMLGCHVSNDFATNWGQPERNSGLVSAQYFFHGRSAHAAGSPWSGRSALDAVELMNIGWNYRREHLRLQQRSHYVIPNGGDQPNVVPSEASVWYYFRELDYAHIAEMFEVGSTMAQGAAMMTGTTWESRVLGSAWPQHGNRPIAEVMFDNIKAVGMPEWSDADQQFAKAFQRARGAPERGLSTTVASTLRGRESIPEAEQTGGASDDVGDVMWSAPTVTLRFPSNIPGAIGHHWTSA